jgi:uncharacterized GH25 family protein
MADITTRETAAPQATVKGTPLTNAEVDANFINLNAEIAEAKELALIYAIVLGEN